METENPYNILNTSKEKVSLLDMVLEYQKNPTILEKFPEEVQEIIKINLDKSALIRSEITNIQLETYISYLISNDVDDYYEESDELLLQANYHTQLQDRERVFTNLNSLFTQNVSTHENVELPQVDLRKLETRELINNHGKYHVSKLLDRETNDLYLKKQFRNSFADLTDVSDTVEQRLLNCGCDDNFILLSIEENADKKVHIKTTSEEIKIHGYSITTPKISSSHITVIIVGYGIYDNGDVYRRTIYKGHFDKKGGTIRLNDYWC